MRGRSPATAETLIILPLRRSRIWEATARQHRKVERRFLLITASHASAEHSVTLLPPRAPPALFTRILICGNVAKISSNRRWTSTSDVTSAVMPSADGPVDEFHPS